MLVEILGFLIAGVCLHGVCFLLYSRERRFPPPPPQLRFPSSCGGRREFHEGTEPSPTQPHKPGQPQDEGAGSSLAVVAHIHCCSCQSPSPLWPHYPAWPRARARIDENPHCPIQCRRQWDPKRLQHLVPPPHRTMEPEPCPKPLTSYLGASSRGASLNELTSGSPIKMLHQDAPSSG